MRFVNDIGKKKVTKKKKKGGNIQQNEGLADVTFEVETQ